VGSDEETKSEIVVAVASSPTQLPTTRRIMRLHGKIGSLDVLILVDSGSVGTFISDLAQQLDCTFQPHTAAQFITANGSPMTCDKIIENLQWSIQGHVFNSEVGVLPLQCYNMILGEDWLESCRPMWVHWKNKVMKFTNQGKRITLYGVKQHNASCTPINAGKLKGLMRRNVVACCLQLKMQLNQQTTSEEDSHVYLVSDIDVPEVVPEVQAVLHKYSHLFQEPSSLPPARKCDHPIELIPGAQLVNVRPYRYAPSQKSEIEKQLTEMLKQGIIRMGSSPFCFSCPNGEEKGWDMEILYRLHASEWYHSKK